MSTIRQTSVRALCLLALASFLLPINSQAADASILKLAVSALQGKVASQSVHQIPATGSIEVGFSPNGGAEALVLKTINAAQVDLKVLAYSFTSVPVTGALLRAVKRGVKVTLVVDEKHNLGAGGERRAKSALSALAIAGASVWTTSAFAIHHDKVIVADGTHVQLGSFNYSKSAADKNSENVLVNWNNPELARVYQEHFQRNLQSADKFTPDY
jgi:phosphatidylserine/phosphatidylglycerophosphate/cardiolipin synthase-like enzyme